MRYQHKTNGATIEVLEIREKYNTALVRDEDGRETELSTSTLKRYWVPIEESEATTETDEPKQEEKVEESAPVESKKEAPKEKADEPKKPKKVEKPKKEKAEKPKREKVDYDQLMQEFAKNFESEHTSVKSYGCSRKIHVKVTGKRHIFMQCYYAHKTNTFRVFLTEAGQEALKSVTDAYNDVIIDNSNNRYGLYTIPSVKADDLAAFGSLTISAADRLLEVQPKPSQKVSDKSVVDTPKAKSGTTKTKKLQVKKTVIKKGGKK